MAHTPSQTDIEFKEAFEACTLSPDKFDHRGHLRLAYVYVAMNTSDDSIDLMRTALKTFIAHHGVPPTKYHETLTTAWILAVNHFMNQTERSDSADAFIDQNPKILDTKIMLTHYSSELLFSDEARQAFIPPNLQPIPSYKS